MTGPPSAPPPGAELGLVLATADPGDVAALAGLAHAARRRGLTVTVFAMHDGVAALAAAPAVISALTDDGCELIGCATSADARGLELAALGLTVGSQDDHAALAHRAHRLVAFT